MTPSPRYTPKSKAEESRLADWLTKSKINWTSIPTPQGIAYEIGCSIKIPGISTVGLSHYQNAGEAFDTLQQVAESLSAADPLLSKINRLLKAVEWPTP